MAITEIKSKTIAAGDTLPLQFEFINSDGTTPDYTGYNGYYILSPFGFEDENVYSKRMNMVTSNSFECVIPSQDTIKLEPGTYTVKLVLEKLGNYEKRARGILDIKKDTNFTGVTM